ncbi:hypothetical protein GCM10009681_40620 [Luedemannella helvata]|uniref:Lipoprotein n=1 Tax=Luedemannella helvata TaxID=349315 RepID=A0ABN2KT32_9ACTN
MAALAGMVLVAVAGCGSGGTPTEEIESAAAWAEPARYAFTLESTCGERWLIGTFRVTVDNGAVAAVEGLDEPARRAVEGRDLTFLREVVPTLSGMVDEAARARSAGAETVEVTVDRNTGHVTRINIDPARNSVDDESCYAVTDYEVR